MGCPYATIFGTPGEGAHSTRILGFALVDTVGTLLLAIVTVQFVDIPFWKAFVSWFILGEVLHYAFGAQTAFLTMLRIKAC